MNKDIKIGSMTNKGLVKMVDKEWFNEDGSKADVIVMTHNGPFRMSEIEKIPRAEKPDIALKDLVEFPTVMSIDIRPGKVKSAERVEKTDKLIHLKVSTNLGTKNIVTNLGEHFEPSDFLGKTFLFIMNMKPMKMRGIESEAMIMAANNWKFDMNSNSYKESIQLMEVNIQIDSRAL